MLLHVVPPFCITATSQSATSYTTVYTGVGSFVVTALTCAIIVLATLRYGFIFFLLACCPCIIPDTRVWHYTWPCWCTCTFKPDQAVTSVKQSPVLKGYHFRVLS